MVLDQVLGVSKKTIDLNQDGKVADEAPKSDEKKS